MSTKKYVLWAFLLLLPTLSLYGVTKNQRWQGVVEFLYLQPMVDDTTFGYINTDFTQYTSVTRLMSSDFFFHPGFRVGGSLGLETFLPLQAYYTRLQAKAHKTLIAKGARTELLLNFGFISPSMSSNCLQTNLNLLYQEVTCFSPYLCISTGSWQIGLQGGLQYADIRCKGNYYAQGYAYSLERSMQFWGLGPQIGALCSYTLPCLTKAEEKYHVIMTGRASLLSSNIYVLYTSSSHILETPYLTILEEKNRWGITPACYARCGIEYHSMLTNCKITCGAGYEIACFVRVLPYIYADHSYDFTNYMNFSVQGLYVSASCCF